VKGGFRAWQRPTTLYLTLLAPALTAFILMIISYAPGWFRRGDPIEPAGFLLTFVGIAIPAAYIFGIVPAFLGAITYCVILACWPAAKETSRYEAVWASCAGALLAASGAPR
jgi:hypothetical protein